MRLLATHRSLLFAFLIAVLCVFIGARAEAQVDPRWDHYKVYRANPPQTGGFPVLLTDQFLQYQHVATALEFFANPVEKRVFGPPPGGQVYPITDSLTHYTWWRINPDGFGALVAVTNQFGDQTLTVHDGVYLLNPALKNAITPNLPVRNHYKCYLCEGQPVNVPVVLTDQFDIWQTTVLNPRWFCNPVFKQVLGGPGYPIVDPRQHYVVYDFNPPDPNVFTALIRDQFTQRNFDLFPGLFLMVPTDKHQVTSSETSTWGKLKTLYRR